MPISIINNRPHFDYIERSLSIFVDSSVQYSDSSIEYSSIGTQYGGSDKKNGIGQSPSSITNTMPIMHSVKEI